MIWSGAAVAQVTMLAIPTLPGRLVAIVQELKILAVSRVEPDTTEREQEVLERLALLLEDFGDRSEP